MDGVADNREGNARVGDNVLESDHEGKKQHVSAAVTDGENDAAPFIMDLQALKTQ